MTRRETILLLTLLGGRKDASSKAARGLLSFDPLSPDVIDALVIVIVDKNFESWTRGMAAYTLGLIGHRRAVTNLKRVGANPEEKPKLRGFAIEALGNIGDPNAITVLRSILFSPAPVATRKWAAYALSQIRVRRASLVLREALTSDLPSALKKEVKFGIQSHEQWFIDAAAF